MRIYVNKEAFEYVELKGKPGVTAAQLSAKLGIKKTSASTWLSKWAALGYLKHHKGKWRQEGAYYIDNSCVWWGNKVFDSERDPR